MSGSSTRERCVRNVEMRSSSVGRSVVTGMILGSKLNVEEGGKWVKPVGCEVVVEVVV